MNLNHGFYKQKRINYTMQWNDKKNRSKLKEIFIYQVRIKN